MGQGLNLKIMTKQEALQKIKELEKFIEGEEKNVVTKFPTADSRWLHINDEVAGAVYHKEDQGNGYKGRGVSGHQASLFLGGSDGIWYNDQGEEVMGYFYYKPK